MEELDEFDRLKAWLPIQCPRTWHQVALTWNWDQGTETLDWILDQPACDRGTALAIYDMGEPDYYADAFDNMDEMRAAKHWGIKDAEFLASICQRWAEGCFPSYRFHPGYRYDRAKFWADIPAGMISSKAPWPVPDSMAGSPFCGEPVDISQFSEGVPIQWLNPPERESSIIAKLLSMIRR